MYIHRRISYNIGPFRDIIKDIRIASWNTLVKAPIGTGKSFLYFDIPLFILYKYSNRNLINAHSSSAWVTGIVQIDDRYYGIHRSLKRSRVKESCSSRIRTWTGSEEEILPCLHQETIDKPINFFVDHSLREEIITKNESDLHQQREQLIPPREVFVTTQMLTQDSEHIFQMQPADRVEVFKHIFGMIGIDHAKEIIQDHRRSLQQHITIKKDYSRSNEQLRQELGQIFHMFGILSESIQTALPSIHQEYSLRTSMKDQLSIDQYSLNPSRSSECNQIQQDLQQQRSRVIEQQTRIQHLDEQIFSYREQSRSLSDQHTALQQQIQLLSTQLSQSPETQQSSIQSQRNLLQKQIEELKTSIPVQALEQFVQEYPHIIDSNLQEISIHTIAGYIQQLIDTGKQLQWQILLIQTQIQQQQELQQQSKQHLQQRLQTLQEQKIWQQSRLQTLQQQLSEIDKTLSAALLFDCEKINDSCPFVDRINASSIKALKTQREHIIQTINQATQDIQSTEQEYQHISQQIQQTWHTPKLDTNQQAQQIQTLQQEQLLIKEFLWSIGWKQVLEHSTQYQQYTLQAQQFDQQLLQISQDLQDRQHKAAQLQQQELSLKHIEQQRQQIESQLQSLIPQREQLLTVNGSMSGDQITVLLDQIQQLQQHITIIQRLISQHQQDKIQLLDLQEQERISSDLVKIFAKDLLREVVRTQLPLISEVLNNYLSQVVEYQIQLDLKDLSNGSLELDTIITDHRGSREVKSLSGGQKVVLKLARILSIASFLRVRCLFLDETINNLDTETIAHVAVLFESFTKKYPIAFVCVTHSPEIQQMNMRDHIIELQKT